MVAQPPESTGRSSSSLLALASSDTVTLERSSLAAASILYLASLRSWKEAHGVQDAEYDGRRRGATALDQMQRAASQKGSLSTMWN